MTLDGALARALSRCNIRFMRTEMDAHVEAGRRLYQKGDLPDLLQLNPEQIERLIRTGQLCPIQICGETRFDSHEISTLIATYKQVAERKNQTYVQ